MLPMLTFWRADFTAFLKTLYESEAVAIVTLRGRGNSQQFLGMIMRVDEKPVWPTGNWTDSSVFSDERRIKESWSRSQSLLPLPDLSRKIEGDSARRVTELVPRKPAWQTKRRPSQVFVGSGYQTGYSIFQLWVLVRTQSSLCWGSSLRSFSFISQMLLAFGVTSERSLASNRNWSTIGEAVEGVCGRERLKL